MGCFSDIFDCTIYLQDRLVSYKTVNSLIGPDSFNHTTFYHMSISIGPFTFDYPIFYHMPELIGPNSSKYTDTILMMSTWGTLVSHQWHILMLQMN